MVLDIAILIILLISAVLGFRKGFVHTLIHSVGWVGALVVAYLLTPYATRYLKESTDFYTNLANKIRPRFDISLDAIESSIKSLPDSIAPEIDTSSVHITEDITKALTSVFGSVLVFVALFVLLKLLMWLLLLLLSKDYRDGFANVFDGFFGMVFGLLRGAILVLVLMALLLPLSNLLSTGMTDFLNHQLDSSVFASWIYHENILLMLIQNYL